MPDRREKLFLACLFLTFLAFTWRSLLFFYSGDDMMNLWKAWTMNPWRLGRSLLLPWDPVYRPLGGAIYRVFYKIFGFQPAPLYTFCYLLLVANFFLAWRFLRIIALPGWAALSALALTAVHGRFTDLYISAGTIYDRLVFLFTVLALIVYAEARRREGGLTWKKGLLVWLLCLGAMDSKESGVVAPALLLAYELIYIGRSRLRELTPLAVSLAALGCAFVFGRVQRTPDLTMTPDYHAKITPAEWLDHVGRYFTTLSYDHIVFHAAAAGAVMAVTLLISLGALRRERKVLLFAWVFFALSILPVASIPPRLGYVLYVPLLGLGAWAAGALEWALGKRGGYAVALAVAVGAIAVHAKNWTPFPDPKGNPEYRLTTQFRSEHPKLNPYTKLLFASDDFPEPAWDLKFNLELMYGVPLDVRRLHAPPDQQPVAGQLLKFDYIFAAEDGHYVELDNRNPEESIRLHVLRHASAGRHMSILNRDHGAYIVSGVLGGEPDNPGRWTLDKATLKFDVYPAEAKFTLRYFVAEQTLEGSSLSVAVNGHALGTQPLRPPGLKEISFAVPAGWIAREGFTLVNLTVDKPLPDAAGNKLGVVLTGADFEYAHGAGGQ